jgi:hypothetical protein
LTGNNEEIIEIEVSEWVVAILPVLLVPHLVLSRLISGLNTLTCSHVLLLLVGWILVQLVFGINSGWNDGT